MSQVGPKLAELDALSAAVEEAISAGEWQAAAGIEAERRRQLGAYLAAETARRGNLEHLRDELLTLQLRNQRWLGEMHHHRRTLEREAATLRQGHRAVCAYDAAEMLPLSEK